MSRKAAREKALQALFQVDVGKNNPDTVLENLVEEGFSEEVFLHHLFFNTINNLEEIDRIISEHLEKWTLERLANVDRNVLRLAVSEMKYTDDVPSAVTINEAVELGKRFGDEKSGSFINGVLSKIKDELKR
ncbi:transcription antitermination factor NusB [Caldibacillus thermolactis]|jgi:transcription antitermination protein NusB|uniref:Transcription antitermination protein NusB n=1 Tax=Pallidibacillus thermolactis TaxID=251051 RepID=A0ABT2WJA3_9BACI|nr:transcription antitermination factor NusB [Pallidibacillus thermolactis]MCU9594092.1 transcription antitermination factor NusB [Pallidibacillus thermolactis]MCU9600317.1 transcription antitermination factor NusB [Pallidibacillus thermolactis subsp. kokeshiiformis]MED1672980.1 transcription antitermination factor NusB [Pallidibacillus thermolactis subsp. kokeshiiformis]